MTATDGELVIRLLVAFGLSYLLGFERQLRGSPAGDRTFSLIGIGTALIGVLSQSSAPNALAGAVTGIGFIGGGLIFRQNLGQGAVVRGVTSAAAIFAVAAIGAAAGEGRLLLATVGAGLVLVCLEVQHIPGLRSFDAHRWQHRFSPDGSMFPETPTPAGEDQPRSGPEVPPS
jgi:putative Mg2+ transporter-C (MgtC) family protein